MRVRESRYPGTYTSKFDYPATNSEIRNLKIYKFTTGINEKPQAIQGALQCKKDLNFFFSGKLAQANTDQI
jgi:hypothetical protein